MPDIVITEFMDPEPIERLRARYDVHVDEELWQRPDELRKLASDAVAVIVRNRTQVDKALIDAGVKLKAVGRLGVGLDNIDLEACKLRSIAVLPAFGVNARSVAEYVLATSMILLRGSALLGPSGLISGGWPRVEMGQGREASGKVIGLIGYGSIGRATGELLRAVGLETIAYDEYLAPKATDYPETSFVGLDGLLATADVVSLHCPLSAQTRNLLTAERLGAMKRGAILINTARGGIVDERALSEALRSGHLGGAAVDVFAEEPITREAGQVFVGLSNVILTPHIAGITREANARTSSVTVDNVLRTLEEKADL